MNALVPQMAEWLRRLPASLAFALGLLYVTAIVALDHFSPPSMSFVLFYLPGVVLVAWTGGRWPAQVLAFIAAAGMFPSDYRLSGGTVPTSALLWNGLSRLVLLLLAGWLVGELARLTRTLGQLVEERTAQWQAEAKQHQATAAQLREALGVLGRDVSERKRTEEALRLSQRQLAEAMDLARLASWEYDVASGRFSFDERFFRLYGTTAESEGGNQMSPETYEHEFLFPEDARLVTRGLAQALAATDPNHAFQVEHRIRRRDGQVRQVLVRVAITKDDTGRTAAVRGVNQDITERKQAEQQLAEALDLNQRILAASPMGIVAYKASGECVFANQTLTRLVGGTVAEHLGQNFRQMPTWQRDGLLALAERTLREGKPQAAEIHGISSFGREVWLDFHMAPFSRGDQPHLLCMLYDISARRRLERQVLEISDREQARIGQDLHDGLCQQLVSLAFDANSLEQSLGEESHDRAVLARRIAQLLDESITEARNLSRGLFPVRLQADGLASAFEELARFTRSRSGVNCRFGAGQPVRIADQAMAIQLYRIAQEAVNNAVKHAQARSIHIELGYKAGSLVLSITDDGRGLSPEAAARPQGLGLHIMDYRARSLGGSLELQPGPRRGTTICCCVPCPQH